MLLSLTQRPSEVPPYLETSVRFAGWVWIGLRAQSEPSSRQVPRLSVPRRSSVPAPPVRIQPGCATRVAWPAMNGRLARRNYRARSLVQNSIRQPRLQRGDVRFGFVERNTRRCRAEPYPEQGELSGQSCHWECGASAPAARSRTEPCIAAAGPE